MASSTSKTTYQVETHGNSENVTVEATRVVQNENAGTVTFYVGDDIVAQFRALVAFYPAK